MAILLDASHAMYRNIFMNLRDVTENPDYFAHLILNGYLAAARNFGAADNNRVIVAMDARPTWRHEFYAKAIKEIPDYEGMIYKGGRVKDEKIPWEILYKIHDAVHRHLDQHSDFDVLLEDNAEADDIIACAAVHFKAKGERVFVVSSDKDFKQLQDHPQVVQYDPIRRIFIPEMDADFYLKKHVIMGDKADNIPAIKARVGEKTAEKMVPGIDKLLATDPMMRKKYEFNKTLIDFSRIPAEIRESIVSKLEGHGKNFNMIGIGEMCKTYSLRKIFGRVQEFSLPRSMPKTTLNSFLMEEKVDNSLDSFFK